MSRYFNDYKKFISQYKLVGTNMLFLSNDGYLENVCSGYAFCENKQETNLHSIYKIASVSKVIVAIGLLKLYDKGLINLDEDISVYLGFKVQNPFYPNDKITIRMLMTQTSSIIDNGGLIDGIYKGYYGANNTNDYITLKDILTIDSKHYYKTYGNYKPGSKWNYSNLGCGILACIIEKTSGIYFPEYIKQELLHPLGIYSGFRLEDIEDKENLVGHYFYENDKFVLHRNYDSFKEVQCLKYPLGDNYRGVAGGLYISAYNLSKIMQMLMHKGLYNDIRILKETTVIEMEKIQWEGESGDPTYKKKGLQMAILDEYTESPLYGHFGNAYGLRSFMFYNKNGGMIFLCNGGNFITDEDHKTILLDQVIQYIINKTNI